MPKAVVKKHIDESLLNVIRLFEEEKTSTQRLSILSLQIQLPKLATIELCGWIEDTQDKIALRAGRLSKLKNDQLDKFEKNYIKNNWSFTYKDFRKMLTLAIGQKAVYELEKNTDAEVQLLQSKLADLKKMRDEYSHSHRPSIAAIKSPEHIHRDYFYPVLGCFIAIENEIKEQFKS